MAPAELAVLSTRVAWYVVAALPHHAPRITHYALRLLAAQAAVLPIAVRISRLAVECRVGPLALQLPDRTVGEGHERHVECPRALVAIFSATGIVPRIELGVGARLRKLVRAHVGDRRQSLRVTRLRIPGVAPSVTIEIEREGHLDLHAAAAAVAVPSAILLASTSTIRVHHVEPVRHWRHTVAREDGADFGHDVGHLRRVVERGAGVHEMAEV